VQLAARRNRDGGRRRIEVAELGRARKVIDTVREAGMVQRRRDVLPEFVAGGREPSRRVVVSEC
jgi:hypothetical protein